MNGFFININNGLLRDDHRKRMGSAVWEFMWFLDKMTSVSEEGVGLVLGGKPIKYEDVNEDLEIPLRDYRRHIERLKSNGYINTKRTPYGLIISINKAKKIFAQRSAKNGTSENEGEVPKMAHLTDKNGTSGLIHYGTSNKTRQLDKTVDKTKDILADKPQAPKEIKKYARAPLEKQTQLQRICYLLEDTLQTNIVNWGKQAKALSMMLKAGYNEKQITFTIKHMAQDDFYVDKGFDLMTVANNISHVKATIRREVKSHVSN